MTVDEFVYLYDSTDLISPHVQQQLPANYTMRPLKRNDDQFGFISLLSQLSVTGDITPESFQNRFDLLKKSGSTYITVIEDENRDIIASATLLVEHKFLHACGSVGHIEDVVVHDSQRGKKLGIRLIDQLYYIAQKTNCYKTILNCNDKNVAFYEKCDLKKSNVQMSRYFNDH